MNVALLLKILRKATGGAETYHPQDHTVPALRAFQLMVETAREADEEGLIEASFQSPSKGKTTAGLVRSFIVKEITRSGLERLAHLSARGAWPPIAGAAQSTPRPLP